MSDREKQQVLADRGYWRKVASFFGYTTFGFNGRSSAALNRPKSQYELELNAHEAECIVGALNAIPYKALFEALVENGAQVRQRYASGPWDVLQMNYDVGWHSYCLGSAPTPEEAVLNAIERKGQG